MSLEEKAVLLKCAIEIFNCHPEPCDYWYSNMPDYYGDESEEYLNDACVKCKYRKYIMHTSVCLPDELASYGVGDEIKDYVWNVYIIPDFMHLSSNDEDIKKYEVHEKPDDVLENHSQKFTILNAVVIESPKSVINGTYFVDCEFFKKKEKTQNNRIKILTDLLNKKELNKQDLVLNLNDILCTNYIEGSDEYTAEQITKLLCEKKFLINYCHYKKLLKEAKKIGKYNEDEIKQKALDLYSKGVYPELFPWQEEAKEIKRELKKARKKN